MQTHAHTPHNPSTHLRSSCIPAWLLVLAMAAMGCSEAPMDQVSRSRQAIVHEDVSQIEFSEGTDIQQEWGTAVGLITNTSRLSRLRGDGTPKQCPDKTQVSYDCTAVLDVAPDVMCSDQIWAGQDSGGSCTAFMIKNEPGQPAIFATAGHCLPVGPDCSSKSVVLHWRPASGFPGGNPNVLEQHIYQCTSVLAHGGHTDAALTSPQDWAVFEVDREVSGGGVTGGPFTPGREALPISSVGPVTGSSGTTIGHPAGLPTKIDPEVTIGGLVTNRGAGTFYAFLDGMEGQSGSPIIDPSGEVVGILTGAKGPLPDSENDCYRQCYKPPGPSGEECPPLTGVDPNSDEAFATIGVNISQLPTAYRSTAETVVILLDQTGSMTEPGMADGMMKWDDAINAASQWVQLDRLTAPLIDRAYSIWTFRNDTTSGGTQNGIRQIWPEPTSADCYQYDTDTGFCTLPRSSATEPPGYDELQLRLETVRETHRPVTGPNTPLAHSLCAGMEELRTIPGIKRIIVESDGGENATLAADPCHGVASDDFGDWSVDLSLRALSDWGMTLDSWQAKVVRRAARLLLPIDTAVASPLTATDWFPFDFVWHVDVHFQTSVPAGATTRTFSPRNKATESVTNTRAASASLTADASGILDSELSLFGNLGHVNPGSTTSSFVRTTGTGFGVDHPITGDVDNSGCVDRADLCLMMREDVWAQSAVAPNELAVLADLNRDGWVTMADRSLVFSEWGAGCGTPAPLPDPGEAVSECRAEFGHRWLSFEDEGRPWSVGSGAVDLSTPSGNASHLDRALQIDGCGYALINSPLFSTAELASGNHLAFDVQLPDIQQNPYWLGDAQLLLSIPSAGIYNAWIGIASFSGLTTGEWHTLTMDTPAYIQAALATPAHDAQLHIGYNSGNCLAPALLDNLRVLP